MELSSKLTWRKSTRSANNGGCVEVAPVHGLNAIAVRDSRDAEGPQLNVTLAAWTAVTIRIRHGGDA